MEDTMKRLMSMADGVGKMAEDAKKLLGRIYEIRVQCEEVEAVLQDCIALMGK